APAAGAHVADVRGGGPAVAPGGPLSPRPRGGGGGAGPAPAVFLGDQRGEPAGVGQSLDELRRIGALAVELAPVGAVELQAELANRIADFGMRGRVGIFHGRQPRAESRGALKPPSDPKSSLLSSSAPLGGEVGRGGRAHRLPLS